MRPFGILPQSAVKRSGDRVGSAEIATVKSLYRSGAGSWTAPEDGIAHVYLWGASAGSGESEPGLGGATRKPVRVRKGDVISFVIGAGGPGYANGGNSGFRPGGDGGNSTATLPDGSVLTATGGKGTGSGERNGMGSGGVENRLGGSGPRQGDGDPVGTSGGRGSVAFADIPGIGSRGGSGGWQVIGSRGEFYGGPATTSEGFGATGGYSPRPPDGVQTLKSPDGGAGAIYIDFYGAVP